MENIFGKVFDLEKLDIQFPQVEGRILASEELITCLSIVENDLVEESYGLRFEVLVLNCRTNIKHCLIKSILTCLSRN
jgi:hypothetical protein